MKSLHPYLQLLHLCLQHLPAERQKHHLAAFTRALMTEEGIIMYANSKLDANE
ncbi:MAG: hypothetical protein J6K41_06020 [Paraprevotella sp.]|nr:hypothetical protein [Paraprevotella sp.]